MSISVEFPHGAGGSWLSHVIHCTINDTEFTNSQVNWHQETAVYAQHNVSLETTPNFIKYNANQISISSCNAKYNFWVNYFKKRVIHELVYTRYKNIRLPVCPYQENTTQYEDFEWLLNQCKFIIRYEPLEYNLNWTDLYEDKISAWNVICDRLAASNLPTLEYKKFCHYVDIYLKSLAKIVIRPNHKYFHIWAIALLEINDLSPNFNVFENLATPEYYQWYEKHKDFVLNETKKLVYFS